MERLLRRALEVREPENLFSGLRLPPDFSLPDNILVFYHNYVAAAPNAHGRHTMVIPFAEMTYFVDQRKIALAPGQVLIIPPHSLRYLHPGSAGYGRLFITFEMARGAVAEAVLSGLDGTAEKTLDAFLRSYAGGGAAESALELYRLLKTLVRSRLPGEAAAVMPQGVAKALEFIGGHLAEPIGAPEIAGAARLSESRLRAVFRRATGMSPGAYLASQRLDAAKRRLLTTDMRVSEIATACGFADIYVFSAFFRKHAGLPPSAFRRRFRPGGG